MLFCSSALHPSQGKGEGGGAREGMGEGGGNGQVEEWAGGGRMRAWESWGKVRVGVGMQGEGEGRRG